MKRRHVLGGAVALALSAACGVAQANSDKIKIGVSISSTGPAASLGIAQKNTVELLPKTLGGLPVEYIVLDDATDPTTAGKNARRFVEADKVDAIIGSSSVPTSMAIAEVATETKVPALTLAPFTPKQIEWVFPLPQSVGVMADALFEDIKRRGFKKLGFIGFSDAYGEAWYQNTKKKAEEDGISLVAAERFARTDQSVTAQALKLTQARPDAIIVAGSGTPSALPMRALRERGFKGQIYQTHGAANNDFLRVAGKSNDGAIFPSGLVLVAEQLPDDNPSKKVALAYLKDYESKYGTGSRNPFGAYGYDAYLLLDRAAANARKTAKPGTQQFRQALRDSLENGGNVPLTHGMNNMSKTDHSGMGAASRVLITIENDQWKLLK